MFQFIREQISSAPICGKIGAGRRCFPTNTGDLRGWQSPVIINQLIARNHTLSLSFTSIHSLLPSLFGWSSKNHGSPVWSSAHLFSHLPSRSSSIDTVFLGHIISYHYHTKSLKSILRKLSLSENKKFTDFRKKVLNRSKKISHVYFIVVVSSAAKEKSIYIFLNAA